MEYRVTHIISLTWSRWVYLEHSIDSTWGLAQGKHL